MIDIDTLKTMDAASRRADDGQQERVLRRVHELDRTRPHEPERASQPRPRRRRAWWIALPVAAVAVIGGHALLSTPTSGQVVLAAPSSADLASWQSRPMPVVDPVKERNACLSASGADLGTSRDARFLLEERRGDFTSMIASYGDQTAFCIVNGNGKGLLDSMTGLPMDVTRQPSTGLTQAVSGGRLDGPVDERQQYATGRAAPDVRSVTFTLDDGRVVDASLEDGWFAAWWPGAATSAAAEVTWTLASGDTRTMPYAGLDR
ncbi:MULTISPECIES: hypothetical protein [unclassified Curtobacterium]|uniref:hypothetical protein n=1 Tax=unclassified Curtobacterium TaxID=257496 RepID=UPI00226BB453|nr:MULTISPECIES: hypothetical protein [unclassified Curtobacterium]